MIVCLCKRVSDRQIRALARDGATLSVVQQETGCGTCCGQCKAVAAQIVDGEQCGTTSAYAAVMPAFAAV